MTFLTKNGSDTKIYHSQKVAGIVLETDIDSLESRTWLLRFNPKKCHVLSLGKLENTCYTMRYKIYESELEHVFEEKDLGVTVDMQLKFEEHIASKIRTANAMMGVIRRCVSFLSCYLFRKLYIAFVRPLLEYAQAVWAPILQNSSK